MDKFTIERLTGVVKVMGALTPGASYLINVRAQQVDKAEREARASLDIRVSGTSFDAPSPSASTGAPTFTHDIYMAEIPETSPVTSQVVQVSAINLGGVCKFFNKIRLYKYVF